MTLDCTTENGRRYIAHQHECLRRFCAAHGVNYVTTDDEGSADVDAILYRSNTVAVAEVKSRNLTHGQLEAYGSYLVSQSKLERLMALARGLRCVGLLLVYLIPERRTVWWKVCGREGVAAMDWRVERTETSRTCNDDRRVEGLNAYLPLTEARG